MYQKKRKQCVLKAVCLWHVKSDVFLQMYIMILNKPQQLVQCLLSAVTLSSNAPQSDLRKQQQ